MRNKNIKNYDIEFKKSSVKLAMESDKPIADTARSLGINENTLYGWVKKFGRHIKKTSVSAGTDTEKMQIELVELRKENARLKQERDILKKAAAYFAGGHL